MKSYISNTENINGGFCVEAKCCYIEIPIDDLTENKSASRFLYFVPIDGYSIYILACFNNIFNSILQFDSDDIKLACKTWPIMMQALYDGIEDKYSEGALIQIEDFDNGDKIWALTTYVGNIIIDENILENKKILNACSIIVNKADSIINELGNNKPNVFLHRAKQFGKGFVEGFLSTCLILFGGDDV